MCRGKVKKEIERETRERLVVLETAEKRLGVAINALGIAGSDGEA